MSTVRYVTVMCDGCGREDFHGPTGARARAAARRASWWGEVACALGVPVARLMDAMESEMREAAERGGGS